MKDLIDLVNLVTRPKLRSIELIGEPRKAGAKLTEFYDKIVKGEFLNDDAAAQSFYHTNKQAPGYKKLRKNLKDRLINALFLIDLKQASYTDRQKAYYECYKEWAAAKILFGKNARSAALSITTKLLKVVRKYEFTELLVDICHTLRLYHGTIDGDFEKYQHYNTELKEAEKIWHEEILAEEYYIELNIINAHSKASKAEYQSSAKNYYTQLKSALNTWDTYHLHLYGRLIESYIYASVNEHNHTLKVCDNAITFFLAKKYVAAVPLQVFYYQKAVCYVQLNELQAAINALELSLQYVQNGQFNWFKAQELKFIIYLHQQNYVEGWSVLNLVFKQGNYGSLPRQIKEIWKIAEAYMAALYQMGKLELSSADQSRLSKFRVSRFLNEMQVYSKDKQGMNIHALILEMWFYLIQGEKDKFFIRYEAIDKYRIRYLREKEVERCNLLLKLLLSIPKAAFIKTDVRKRTQKDLHKLRTLSIERSRQTLEMELLPYEYLWAFVFELLD